MALLCIVPSFAHAAIVISEVAWMGTAVSPNDEWIELHNTGSSVSVDGWILKDGAGFEVALEGTIPSDAYAVLERTDDSTAEGPAFLLYTGALANTGSVLSLYRADGSLEDQVAGGENWESIGGDNATKETAQYTTSGWKTAPPTPGRGIGLSEMPDDLPQEQKEESEAQNKDSNDENKIVELTLPNVTLVLSLLVPDIVYVSQPVAFDLIPHGLGETILNSLNYEWNFGDFATAHGKQTQHAYAYPGEYVVTVKADYVRHTQVARKTITVLPVAFSLMRDAQNNILLQNNAKYEVNISGYSVLGTSKVVFPERSVILANGTIMLPKEKIIKNSRLEPVSLYDQEGILVASTAMSASFVPDSQVSEAEAKQIISTADDAGFEAEDSTVSEETSNFSFGNGVKEESASLAEDAPSPTALVAAPPSKKAGVLPEGALPLLGLIGIVTLGLIAVFAGGNRHQE